MAFNPILDGVVAMVLSPIKLTGALARAAETIGVIPDVHQAVEEQLPGIIESVSAPFGLFLAETLARLSAGLAVFMRLNADEPNWRVQHTAEAERAAAPLQSLGDDFHESLRRPFLPRAQS